MAFTVEQDQRVLTEQGEEDLVSPSTKLLWVSSEDSLQSLGAAEVEEGGKFVTQGSEGVPYFWARASRVSRGRAIHWSVWRKGRVFGPSGSRMGVSPLDVAFLLSLLENKSHKKPSCVEEYSQRFKEQERL